MKCRQAILKYYLEHATSLRGKYTRRVCFLCYEYTLVGYKYTRRGCFLCNVCTLVGYAKPSTGSPNYSNGSSIPQTSYSTAILCRAEPILQYDWNSRFHTQAPAWSLHLFRAGVCLIHGAGHCIGGAIVHTCALWVFAVFFTIGPK